MTIDAPLHKYDTPNLTDPLVRCVSCSHLVHQKYIHHGAGCNHCGNKRVQIIQAMSGEELNALRDETYDLGLEEYTIDPEYLAIFKAVEV